MSVLLLARRLEHIAKDGFDRRANVLAAADVNPGALLPEIHHGVAIVGQPVLDVLAALGRLGCSGIGTTDFDRPECLPLRQLVGVQVVRVGRSAAKEQQGGGYFLASGYHGGALLHEAPEGGQARPGRNANDGRVFGVGRQVECLRGSDCHVEALTGCQRGQVVTGDAVVWALSGEGGLLQDGVCERYSGAVGQGRR